MIHRYNVWATALVASLCLPGCKSDPMVALPAFNLQLPDSVSVFSTASIPEGQPVIFVHFNSDCKECQDETALVLKHMNDFRNVRFVFLTVEKFEQLKLYESYYKLGNYPNITAGRDYEAFFPRHFKSMSTPYVAVYDSRKELRAMYEGGPEIEELKQLIKKIR